MTMADAMELFDYWDGWPPEHESLARIAGAYTNWEPSKKPSEEEVIAQHRESLQKRWKGGAMNAQQMFEAMGGRLALPGAINAGQPAAPMAQPPGIGPFPGMPTKGT